MVDAKSQTPVLLAKAQEALRERDRAQRYLDTPDVILLALDLDGRITLANRYACSILGWTADELMGRDWVETCLPVRIRDDMKAKLHDLTGGEFTVLENPILTKSGDERLIGWRNTVLHDDKGNVTGVLSSGSDITESREVETALRKTTADLRDHTKLLEEHAAALLKSEERTTYALRAARMGLWELDMATGELTWSPTMAPLFGLRPDQVLTTAEGFFRLIHPDDRRMVETSFGQAAAAGSTSRWNSASSGPMATRIGSPRAPG